MDQNDESMAIVAGRTLGCLLFLVLITFTCGAYFFGKYVARTELTNEILIQRIQSGDPIVPVVKKEAE